MILVDEDDAKDIPVTNPTIRYPERAAGRRPCSPLPDYETSQALTYNNFDDSSSTLYKPPARRRFLNWKAVLVSLVAYIIVTLVIGIPIILRDKHLQDEKSLYDAANYSPWPARNSVPYFIPDFNGGDPASPALSGLDQSCNNWSQVVNLEGTSTVQAWADYNISSTGQFAFNSNVSYSSNLGTVLGELLVDINPDNTARNIILSIAVQTSSGSIFDQTRVCAAFAANTAEFFLYVPNNLTTSDQILFNITMLFPQYPILSQVDAFSTFLPLFYQHFGRLSNYVTFDKAWISGFISTVEVDSLVANEVFVETSLQPITGEFSIIRSLSLSTVLAPIEANITLYNDPTSDFPTFLDLDTGNSDMTVTLTVLSPSQPSPPRPNFVTNMRTFNGTMNATILHDPSSPPTLIRTNVENGLGPLNLVFDEKYQGTFRISTKQAVASVTQGDVQSPDLSGSGLPRNFTIFTNFTSRVDGWIGWGQQCGPWGAPQGEIAADTSLADATVYFTG